MKPLVVHDLLVLFVLALPVAAVAWTVTHEELFRELQDYCVRGSQRSTRLVTRKFFYLLTCEYCFSHYIAAGMLLMTRFTLLYEANKEQIRDPDLIYPGQVFKLPRS